MAIGGARGARPWLVAGLCLVGSVALAADPTTRQDDAGRTQAFAEAMQQGMTKMMADMHAPGMTNDPDRDFLAMMIPHHEGAVEMARLVLIHGRDPLVRRLAEEIIASQQAEIAAMRARLAILTGGTDPDPGGFPAIHGTRGAAPAAKDAQPTPKP